MKLRGVYSGEKSYEVGDAVVYTDQVVYHLQKPCKAGTPPTDTRYWGRLGQTMAEAALMVMDAKGAIPVPDNISESAIILKSSTPDSDKQFIITVDDDGELTATELEQEGE